jgi:glutathione S-transferase
MMKLHGGPLSNYYNMVKHAVLEKGIACEFIETRPSQDAAFLLKSPMGKVPLLETRQGFLTETNVILDYLEESHPAVPLLPADCFARAKARQLMKTQELYVETPAHDLIGAIFQREIPAHVKVASQVNALRGLAALGRLVNFNPWICGEQLTSADIFVFYSFTLSNRLTQLVYNWDMLKEIPGLDNWYKQFAERTITQGILADSKAVVDALAARMTRPE